MQQMMLLGPEKAFKLFKSMMTTEVKIMLQLLFEVCLLLSSVAFLELLKQDKSCLVVTVSKSATVLQ